MNSSTLAPDVYEVLTPAVVDALATIRVAVESRAYIGRYFDYPSFSHFKSGVPHLSTNSKGPLCYQEVLRASEILKRPQPHFDSWYAAVRALSRNERLREYYRWTEPGNILFAPEPAILGFIADLAARYIHVTGKMEFDEVLLAPIYREWESGIFLPKLSFDLWIPIIFVDFDLDEVRSESGVFTIARIPEPVQLARADNLRYASVGNALVAGGASHALILRNWTIANGNWWEVANSLGSAEAFADVHPIVERFFAALRVETGCETGYSQVVIRPHGWALRWRAGLPPVSTYTVREYPDRFDAHGWLRTPCQVAKEQARAAVDLCDALTRIEQNKLELACRRLNRSYLRSDESDSVLDITMALEALLADDTTSELAYRLAMRMGALAGAFEFGGYSPESVFKLCKRVYDYRSAVVHGNRASEKKRLIREHPAAEPVPAISVGLALLRSTIRVLAHNPELLSVQRS